MPSMGSQTDLESQLFEMITKQNKLESLIIKNAPKVPVPDSVAVLAFKRVGPILGPVWTLLSPLSM